MKYTLILLLIILLKCSVTGKNISTPSVNNNLIILAKVYGLIKFRSNNLNYEALDKHTISTIKLILKSSESDISKIIYEYIYNLNYAFKITDSCRTNFSRNNLDFNFVDNFNQNTKMLLTSFVVNKVVNNTSVIFDEDGYITKINNYTDEYNSFPSLELRILAVFQYWNAILYFCPNLHLTDTQWNNILPIAINEIFFAESEEKYHKLFLKLATYLNDGHSFISSYFLGNYFGWNYEADFNVLKIENKYLITNICPKIQSSLIIGDIILTVDNISLSTLEDSLLIYASGANEGSKNYDFLKRFVFSSLNKNHLIGILRNGAELKIEVEYYSYQEKKEHFLNDSMKNAVIEIDNKICYIDVRALSKQNYHQTFKKASKYQNVILDLRYYPFIDLFQVLSDCLISNDTFMVNEEKSLKCSPGKFFIDSNFKAHTLISNIKYNDCFCHSRIIGIVSAETVSHVEYICMILKTSTNYISVGVNSAGSDGNIIRMELPGGIYAFYTGVGVLTKSGESYQRIGIRPDVRINLNLNSFLKGTDKFISKAIEVANN